MIPLDINPLQETDGYAVWLIDNFDMNSTQTRATFPAYNRINGKPFSYATVHAVLKSGTFATGTLAVKVSNECEPKTGPAPAIPSHDLADHPDGPVITAGGSSSALPAFPVEHYWLGFQPSLAEGGTSILKLFVMLKHE